MLVLCLAASFSVFAQQEPKFIKDVAVLNEDGSISPLSPSFGKLMPTMTMSTRGAKAENRIAQTDTLKLIIKVADVHVSPMDAVTIYKMHSHKDSRTTFCGGMISSKDVIPFRGDVYGSSSFIIYLVNLEMGEYGLLYSAESIEKSILGEHVMTFFGIDR